MPSGPHAAASRDAEDRAPAVALPGVGLEPPERSRYEAVTPLPGDPGRARVDIYDYGSPAYIPNLLDSTAVLIDREPAQSFATAEARTAALNLSRLLVIRVDEAAAECPKGASG